MPGAENTDTKKDERASTSDKDRPQGQPSDITKYIDSQQLRTNPFEKSLTAEHIYRRAERVAAALFLVTGHVPDIEPLKMSVRDAALRLIDGALRVQASLRSEGSVEAQMLRGAIRTAISRVRFLGVAGYVSHPNVAVLVSALDEMGHLLDSAQRSSLSEVHMLTHDDLIPPIPVARPTARPTREPRHQSVKDIAYKGQSDTGPGAATSTRADRILALLRTRDLMGIKDIAVNLPEYSEKMIQRELADLTEAGRVRKVGAKRWSRYGFVR